MEKALEHLSDDKTYKALTVEAARNKMNKLKLAIGRFLWQHSNALSPSDKNFLQHALDVEKDGLFPQFYILAKIYKTPWKVQPITLVSGSQVEGLGKWLDRQLQRVCWDLPSFLDSSHALVKELKNLPPLPLTHGSLQLMLSACIQILIPNMR